MTPATPDYKTEQQLIARGRRLRAEAMRDVFRAIVRLIATKPVAKAPLAKPAI